MCEGTIAAVRYLVEKAEAVYPQWLGVRFSYGMNGVVMRSGDLKPFATYLAQHVSRQVRPRVTRVSARMAEALN